MKLEYNGVLIRDLQTVTFDEHVQYDESGTDKLFSRFDMVFRGRIGSIPSYAPSGDSIVYREFTETEEGVIRLGEDNKRGAKDFKTDITGDYIRGTGDGSFNHRIRDMLGRLSVPRKDFCYYNESDIVGSRVILVATGEPDGNFDFHDLSETTAGSRRQYHLDTDNGPKPKGVRVIQFFGTDYAEIEFSIEVCRTMCIGNSSDDTSSDTAPIEPILETFADPGDRFVLSNRWSVEDSLSSDMVWTTTTQGTLRVRDRRWWPHVFRYLCIPALRDGYRRTGMHFADDPTGLVLKYRIEDTREHAAPPEPAIAWNVQHTESAANLYGTQRSSIGIQLTGKPGVRKSALLSAAIMVWNARIRDVSLNWNPLQGGEAFSGTVEHFAVIDDVGKPHLTVQGVVLHTENKDTNADGVALANINVFNARLSSMLQPLKTIDGWNPNQWGTPTTNDLDYDTANPSPAQLMHCYLQSPCSRWHDVPDANDLTDTNPENTVNQYGIQYSEDKIRDESERRVPLVTYTESPVEFSAPGKQASSATSRIIADALDFPYTYVSIENDYKMDHGRTHLPLSTARSSGPYTGESTAYLKLHGGTCQRIFVMEATRIGKPPEVPVPNDQVSGSIGGSMSYPIREVLLSKRIIPEAPERMPITNQMKYTVQVEYVYGLSRIPTAGEQLRMAKMPFDNYVLGFTPLDTTPSATGFYDTSGKVDFTS